MCAVFYCTHNSALDLACTLGDRKLLCLGPKQEIRSRDMFDMSSLRWCMSQLHHKSPKDKDLSRDGR